MKNSGEEVQKQRILIYIKWIKLVYFVICDN